MEIKINKTVRVWPTYSKFKELESMSTFFFNGHYYLKIPTTNFNCADVNSINLTNYTYSYFIGAEYVVEKKSILEIEG